MEEANYSDLDLAHIVGKVLNLAPSRDGGQYDDLVRIFYCNKRPDPDKVALIVTGLTAISGAVSCIDIYRHRSLLTAIYRMSFWNYGPIVMDALVKFVISLATSSGIYVELCLHMLVRNFTPPYPFLESLKQPRGLAKKEQVLIHVHSALKDITDLVPLSSLQLEQIVRKQVPNIFCKEVPMIGIYVENMLKLESGSLGEIVGHSMLFELVNRMIDLDVEIGWDNFLQDDPCKGIFKMDVDEPPNEYSGQEVVWRNVAAEKLDIVMGLSFEHLKSCHESGRLVQVFEVLLQAFLVTVMDAYKTKFTQFVMFYACSLDPESCGSKFVNSLFDIFTDGVFSQDRRINAVAYLASYLSRAKFLSTTYVVTILERLVDWCSKYCEHQKRKTTNPRAHRVFYAGSQGIMYILCFHMGSIQADPQLKSKHFLWSIETILKHPLNPLKACLPSIVDEFLHHAKEAQLFDACEDLCFHGILESETSKAYGGSNKLDMFFPFDPYQLKKSDRFIRPNYNFWSSMRTNDDDDEDDDNEGSSGEDAIERCQWMRGWSWS